MTLVVDRAHPDNEKTVHVLIVVVGEYISMANLPGVAGFVDDVVDFWKREPGFRDGRKLATVDVLASEAGTPNVFVSKADGGGCRVARPTLGNCQAAMADWTAKIARVGGSGFLHWVGHGRERSIGGEAVSLMVDGEGHPGSGRQDGMDWSRTLWRINELTEGRPVCCFIDACRNSDQGTITYEGFGRSDASFHDGAMVFRSTGKGAPSFWIDAPTAAVVNAGCAGQGVATRAFLAALETFGARLVQGLDHPILAGEVVEGSSALVIRWLAHQGLRAMGTEGPPGYNPVPILYTTTPEAVVAVGKNAPRGSKSCQATRAGKPATASETSIAPYQFRLQRENHTFDFDKGPSLTDMNIIHPSHDL